MSKVAGDDEIGPAGDSGFNKGQVIRVRSKVDHALHRTGQNMVTCAGLVSQQIPDFPFRAGEVSGLSTLRGNAYQVN
jgi:hypothetical protein